MANELKVISESGEMWTAIVLQLDGTARGMNPHTLTEVETTGNYLGSEVSIQSSDIIRYLRDGEFMGGEEYYLPIATQASVDAIQSLVGVPVGIEHIYTVTDSNQIGIQGAVVNVYQNADRTGFITNKVTDAEGKAVFHFDVEGGTTLYFEVLKSGYKQEELDAEVIVE